MSKLDKIIIGIRDSKLSHAQTDILLNQLISASVNLNSNTFDIKTIKTKGDIHVSQRLDRIEEKIDQMADAIVALARAEEKIHTLTEFNKQQGEQIQALINKRKAI